MLSIETSSDPSCSCKTTSVPISDERASEKFALPKADLLKSGLADPQLSNFSIRGYVFAARSKDIATNWPFAQQYLQFCLRHGIKDVLPPFEPPDTVKNRCLRKSVGNEQLFVRVDGCEGVDKDPYPLREKENLTLGPEDTNLSRSSILSGCNETRGEGDTQSTVNCPAKSQSESLPTNRLSCSAQGASTLSETSVEVRALATSGASHKAQNTTEQSGKKCRLMVKLGIHSNPSRGEDFASNTTSISEPMASKVCPVCKTFSSTSNTTLNAHIDQCLAMESTAKFSVNFKPTRHKIKPRKKRSMIDICATAPPCTLEELDKRNGSNWAVELSMPCSHAEVCAEGKRQRLSPEVEDSGDEGAVYVDSNGTKIRILSKFNNVSAPSVGGDSRPRKHIKYGNERKFFYSGKKRRLGPRRFKYLKLKSQSAKLCSPKVDQNKMHEASEERDGMEENHEKEESLSQLLKSHESIQSRELGTLGQWPCSKRTGLLKKFRSHDHHHGPEYSSHEILGSLNGRNQSNLGKFSVERKHIQKLSNSSLENTMSLKSKRVASPGVQTTGNKQMCFETPENSQNQLNKGSSSSTFDECMVRLPRSSGNHASSSRGNRMEVCSSPDKNSGNSPKGKAKQTKNSHAFLEMGKKLPTLRKNMLVVSPPFTKAKFNDHKEHLVSEKSQLHRNVETVNKVGRSFSDVSKPCDEMQDYSGNQSRSLNWIEGTYNPDCWPQIEGTMDGCLVGRSNASESRQGAVPCASEEGEPTLKVSESIPGCSSHNPDAVIDSHAGVDQCCGDNVIDNYDGLESTTDKIPNEEEDSITELVSRKTVKVTLIRSYKNPVSEPNKLGNHSKIQSKCLPSIEEHKLPAYGAETQMAPSIPGFRDYKETDCSNEIDYGNGTQNAHMETEDRRVGGETSFAEVDPIPIPGPPGSFLPSPGDMGSDALQENSSLTSSRAESSQDQQIVIDGDPSGSPLSVSSTISHSYMGKFDLKYSEPESSSGLSEVHDKFMPIFSCTSTGSAMAGPAKFPCTGSISGEDSNFHRENLQVFMISPAKEPENFMDNQKCCCFKNTDMSQVASQNYEDSQLKQCIVASEMLPSKGSQMSSNVNIGLGKSTSFCTSPNSSTDKMVLPVLEFSKDPSSVKASSDVATSSQSCVSNPASTSSQVHHHEAATSTPVLRLMGKNLVVVNKDEETPVQPRHCTVGNQGNPPSTKHLTLVRFANNVTYQESISFHHAAPDGSAIITQDSKPSPQCFAVNLSNGLKNHCTVEAHQAAGGICHGMHAGSFDCPSLQQHKPDGNGNIQGQHKRSTNKLSSFSCNVERVVSSPPLQHQNAASASHRIQEVIIIDDSPESEEPDSRKKAENYSEILKRNQQSPVHILTSTTPNSTLRQMNPFPCYQTLLPFSPREPPVGLRPNFLLTCTGGAIASPVKWGLASEGSVLHEASAVAKPSFLVSCQRNASAGPLKWGGNSEGPSAVMRSPFMVPSSSSSTNNLNPAMYYASSLL